MPVHIANWKYADIGTAVAGADMAQGQVCKVGASGVNRTLTPLGDADDALVLSGNYAVAVQVSIDPNEVDSSTAPARLGTRIEEIKSGELVMECRKGTILRYTADLLDDSLDAGRGGATPAIGDALGIQGGKWATIAAATSSGIATPVVGRVHKVFGTDVLVELVY